MSIKTRGTIISLWTIFTICFIGLLPANVGAVLFSQPATLGSPTLSFTTLANGSVSSTVAGSGAYTVAAPSGLTSATWGGGCSGASTVSGFSASGGNWNATFTTPSGTGTGCTLAVTGTGSNTASATSPGVTISSGPVVTSITSSCSATQTFTNPPTNCVYHVNFNVAVFLGSPPFHPELNLATSPVPAIAYLCDDVDAIRTLPSYAQACGGVGNGNGTTTLNFGHAVWGGQVASPVTTSSAAVNLNGSTIKDGSGNNANLTPANSVSITGLIYAPGNAYCVTATGGNDSSSGLCGSAAFATLRKCQTAMQGGAVKTCFLEAGTFSGLATSSVSLNTGGTSTSYLILTSSDDTEVWAGYPTQSSPVIDGGSSSSSTGVGMMFYSAVGSPVNGLTRWGLTLNHFKDAGFYDYSLENSTDKNNTCENFFNTTNGAGGCLTLFHYWDNINESHNVIQNMADFSIEGNYDEITSAGGHNFKRTIDNNTINVVCNGIDCGGIYPGWDFEGANVTLSVGTLLITDNIINQVDTTSRDNSQQGSGLYLDDLVSGAYVAGNIVTGYFSYGLSIHNGSNNTFTNNIFDMTASVIGNNSSPGSGGGPQGLFYQNASSSQIWSNCLATQGGSTNCQSHNNGITSNIVYNGNATNFPPNFIGLYDQVGSQLSAPSIVNWYATADGTYSSHCLAAGTQGSGSSGVCDTSPTTISATGLFVNPTAQTAAGFQLVGTLSGYVNIPMTQGLQ